MEAKSVLAFTFTVNAAHLGEVGNINEEDVKGTIKSGIQRVIKEETEEDSRVTILVTTFSYEDNTAAIRAKINDRLHGMSFEDLSEIAEYIGVN